MYNIRMRLFYEWFLASAAVVLYLFGFKPIAFVIAIITIIWWIWTNVFKD
jgi:hypothetical protein